MLDVAPTHASQGWVFAAAAGRNCRFSPAALLMKTVAAFRLFWRVKEKKSCMGRLGVTCAAAAAASCVAAVLSLLQCSGNWTLLGLSSAAGMGRVRGCFGGSAICWKIKGSWAAGFNLDCWKICQIGPKLVSNGFRWGNKWLKSK